MKERPSRMGESSARAIYYRAEAIYEATGQKIADRRLPVACSILNEGLPWEPKKTDARPVQPRTPEQEERTNRAIRLLRGYRV